MRILKLTIAAAALIAAPAVFAFAQDHSGHGDMGPSSMAFMQGMMKMMSGMDMPMTGNADKDFVMMMIPHHQGAIDMAKVELQYGTDPMLKKLAEDIVAAQTKEIGDMTKWQGEHK